MGKDKSDDKSTRSLSADTVASYALLENTKDIIGGEKLTSLADLYDVFALMEAAVLYQNIWYFTASTVEEIANDIDKLTKTGLNETLISKKILRFRALAELFQETPQALISSFKEFYRMTSLTGVAIDAEKIMELFADWVSQSSVGQFTALAVAKLWMKYPGEIGRSRILTLDKLSYPALARSFFCRALGADYSASTFEQPLIEIPTIGTQKNAAMMLYKILKKQLMGEVLSLQDIGVPIPLFIPPIASIILSRSGKNLKRIADEVLNLREEFAEFRIKYGTYQDTIRSPSGYTLGELIQVRRDSFEEVTAALEKISTRRTDSRLLAELFSCSITTEEGESDLTAALSLSGLAKVGLKKVKSKIVEGRARILFDIWKKVMDVKNYHKLVQETLGYEIKKEEIERYEVYCEAIENAYSMERKP